MAKQSVEKIFLELGFFLVFVAITEITRRLARRRWPQHRKRLTALLVCSLVLTWYSVSITLVLFNKWIMTSWRDGVMTFPIFYTTSHMLMKGLFAGSFIRCIRCRRFPRPSFKTICATTFIGVATGLDVAMSNWSFKFISVSFYTMLKSASLIFILFLGVVLRIEPCSLRIFCIIYVIAGGIFLTSYGEAQFNLSGFGLVIGSEVFAAGRWVITQVIVQSGKLDTMSTVLLMAPGSTLSLLPLAFAIERENIAVLSNAEIAIEYLLVIIFPGFLSFVLLLVEVSLVKVTSSLTLSVFGNLKSIVTILLAVLLFGEQATPVQWLGLVIALSGIFAYSYFKKRRNIAIDSVSLLGYKGLVFEDLDEEEAEIPDGWSDWGGGASAWVGDLGDLDPDDILEQAQEQAQARAFGATSPKTNQDQPQNDHGTSDSQDDCQPISPTFDGPNILGLSMESRETTNGNGALKADVNTSNGDRASVPGVEFQEFLADVEAILPPDDRHAPDEECASQVVA